MADPCFDEVHGGFRHRYRDMRTDRLAHSASRPRVSQRALRKRVWAEFIAGDDTLARRELPTEILRSWYRCRDLYRLDPADVGRATPERSARGWGRRWDDVYAQLGGSAAALAHGVSGCLAAVTDTDGNVLAVWSGHGMRRQATERGLEAGTRWSESTQGTSGTGTAPVAHHPILVRGPEHWRRDLHAWTCFGAAVFDPVTDEPVATLTVASLSEAAVAGLAGPLAGEVAATQERLDQRDALNTRVVAEHFAAQNGRRATKRLAIDWAGNIIAATLDVKTHLRTAEPEFTLDACGKRGRTCDAAARHRRERVPVRVGRPELAGHRRPRSAHLGSRGAVLPHAGAQRLTGLSAGYSPGSASLPTRARSHRTRRRPVHRQSRTGSPRLSTTPYSSSIRTRSDTPRRTGTTSGW